MNRVLLGLCALLTAAAAATAPPAGTATDSSGAPDPRLRTTAPHTARAELLPRFVVPHLRSAVFASGTGGRVTSVLGMTNGGASACEVAVDYYFAFNADATPECTVNVTLAPLLAPGSDTANVCSRAIPGDRWTLCTASCSPNLSFIQGKIVVRADPACAADLALDARLYHSDASDDVVAITAMTVASDLDGDAIFEPNDNCSAVANPDQRDSNQDGIGNRCDADLNNDCQVNFLDLEIMRSVFFSATPDADLDGDGLVNFNDLQMLKSLFFGVPGPSDLFNACR